MASCVGVLALLRTSIYSVYIEEVFRLPTRPSTHVTPRRLDVDLRVMPTDEVARYTKIATWLQYSATLLQYRAWLAADEMGAR